MQCLRPYYAWSYQADCEALQVDSWRKVRRRMALPMDARGSDAQEMAAMAQALTREQLRHFVALCRQRYQDKRIDPGQNPVESNCCGSDSNDRAISPRQSLGEM